jgi:hypothetical protein
MFTQTLETTLGLVSRRADLTSRSFDQADAEAFLATFRRS